MERPQAVESQLGMVQAEIAPLRQGIAAAEFAREAAAEPAREEKKRDDEARRQLQMAAVGTVDARVLNKPGAFSGKGSD